LQAQNFFAWSLVTVDNGSGDGTAEELRRLSADLPVDYQLIAVKENLGFAAAHNLAFKQNSSDYFLVLNQDVILSPDALEKMVDFLDAHADASVVAPALYRFNADTGELTEEPDSFGLQVWRNRRVTEILTPPVGESAEVFGVSAAVAMYRRSAVQKVLLDGQMFDEMYGSYKEDVDLAYRLVLAGFKAYILSKTACYHARTAIHTTGGIAASVAQKTGQKAYVARLSYRNHLLTLKKNELWENLAFDWPWIVWYELKKLVYFVLFDSSVLWGLMEIWRNRALVKKYRRQIQSQKKIDYKTLRKWWTRYE